jgi:hypothetical protein
MPNLWPLVLSVQPSDAAKLDDYGRFPIVIQQKLDPETCRCVDSRYSPSISHRQRPMAAADGIVAEATSSSQMRAP